MSITSDRIREYGFIHDLADAAADEIDALEAEIAELKSKLEGEKAAALNYRADAIEAEKQRDELLAALDGMNRAYVNLMENGRDSIIMLGGECDHVDVMERDDPHLRESRAAIASVKGGA